MGHRVFAKKYRGKKTRNLPKDASPIKKRGEKQKGGGVSETVSNGGFLNNQQVNCTLVGRGKKQK